MKEKLRKTLGRLIMIIVGLVTASGPVWGQSSTSLCSESVIPAGMLKMVKAKYPGWRIKTVEDLEPNHQIMWRENRFLDCPGIVKGNFQGTSTKGLGLMLIKDLQEAKGFKIIVISATGNKGHFQLTLLKDEKEQDPERYVIYLAPKGNYSNYDNKQQIEIPFDGIYLEDLEMGSSLYYWKINRFEKWEVVR